MRKLLHKSMPFITTIMAVIISYLPYNVGVIGVIRADLGLALLYYWIIRRPDSMFFSYVFFLGLIADSLSGITLGTHSFTYLMAWLITMYSIRQKLMDTFYGWLINGWVIIAIAYFAYWLESILSYPDFTGGIIFVFSAVLTMGISLILTVIVDIQRRLGI